MKKHVFFAVTSLFGAHVGQAYSLDLDISGRVGFENRFFFDDSENQAGVLAEPEIYWESESGDDNLTLTVFARYDNLDDERSHFDIREALWLHVGEDWEFRAGIGKVFWGVTESNHLVDVINQTDAVESADGEQKLGQPMLQYTSINDWGVMDFFVLPGFRERTFPGEDGRLRGPVTVDTDRVFYESDQEEKHVDYAIRYSHSFSIFDLGVSGFSGTNREAKIIQDGSFRPFYDQMTQLGIDAQATVGDWLIKLESIYREDSEDHFNAQTMGFEYTFINVFELGLDIGALAEYSRDSRDETGSALNNDAFTGMRLTLNDIQSTELLVGLSQDLDKSSSKLMFIEGNRRIGDSWKLTIDARLFSSDEPEDPIYFLRDEDYASLTMERFF